MLAQDVGMWGFNIYFLIGLLIVGGVCLAVLVAIYIGIRMWVFTARQRASMAEYYRRTRRADGKKYPPFIVGTCDRCRRICKKVYHLTTDERLCPECYEPFWRHKEGWTEPPPPSPRPLLSRILRRQ